MSQNGTPPPENITHFNDPANMVGFFILDRAVADLNMTASQLQAIGKSKEAHLAQLMSVRVAQFRDNIRKEDESGIVVAGVLPREPV